MQYHFKEYRTVQKIEITKRKDNLNGWNSFSNIPRKIADIRGITARRKEERTKSALKL